MTAAPTTNPLDDAAWASLSGPHRIFAEGTDKALRYPVDISPFAAIVDDADPEAWDQLRQLNGAGRVVRLTGVAAPPDDWATVQIGEGVQLISTARLETGPDAEAVVLGESDMPEMLALIKRTEPGPFLPRTYLLGTYLGIRRDGGLIAMAGERMHPAGYTEISAVCTDAQYRRQGLGARLVRAIGHGIRERGDTPFMHAAGSNHTAIRLYEAMGFELRRTVTFAAFRAPD
jgi:predicted GNAT family acetyltransferase